MGCKTQLSHDVIRAYEAPFPDDRYKAGARVFPTLVPTRPDDPASAPNRIEGAGHFVQEDKGEELARVVLGWLAGEGAAAG